MDFKDIKELIRVFDKSELSKLKVKEGDFEISMGKGADNIVVASQGNTHFAPSSQTTQTTPSVAQTTASLPEVCAKPQGETINAPMIGTFYAAPSPESPAFVKVGDTIKAGQTLCILEAMKIMNEVEAEYACKIIEILIKDGQPVEYDMPLFVVEKI